MPYDPTGDGPNSKTTRSNPVWCAVRIAVSWAWALGSPPFCGGHATGGGVPVAPVGAGLGLGEGVADGVADGRATLGLGLGAADAEGTELGAGDGVTVGRHAAVMSTIKRNETPRTFLV